MNTVMLWMTSLLAGPVVDAANLLEEMAGEEVVLAATNRTVDRSERRTTRWTERDRQTTRRQDETREEARERARQRRAEDGWEGRRRWEAQERARQPRAEDGRRRGERDDGVECRGEGKRRGDQARDRARPDDHPGRGIGHAHGRKGTPPGHRVRDAVRDR